MNINDILNLEYKKTNLKKIDSFISKCDVLSLEYARALSYKARMLFNLENTKDAITLLLSQIRETSDSEQLVCYYSEMINIYLELSDFDKAMKYINLKDNNLSILNKAEHTKDLILFYNKLGDKENTIKYINLYLEDDISEEDKTFVLSLLEDFYYNDNDINSFNNNFNYLEYRYKEKNEIEKLEDLYTKKLDLLFRLSPLEETRDFIKSIDFSLFSKKIKIKAYIINLEFLIEENNLRKAAQLESEYENEIEDVPDKTLLKEYYQTALKIYSKINNTYSLEFVNKKLAELEEETSVKEQKKKSRFNDIPQIIIEERAPEKVNFDPRQLRYITSDSETVNVSENYIKLNSIFEELNKSKVTKTREIVRTTLLKFSEEFKIYEAHILSLSKYKGYLYKGGRLYDKKLGDNFDKSVLVHAIEQGEDLIINDLNESYYTYDIINNSDNIFKSCFVFNIGPVEDKTCIGFFFLEPIKNFEYYKFIASLIGFIIDKNEHVEINEKIKESLLYLENKFNLGIKRTEDNVIYLNDTSKNMLKLNTNCLTNNDYCMLLEKKDINNYNKVILDLLNETYLEYSLEYKTIHNTIILEYFYKLEDNTIISYIEDVTKKREESNELFKIAYLDTLTNVKTFKTFNDEALEILKNHDKALVILDSLNFNTYLSLYGFEFSRQIIKSIANFLILHKNFEIYYIEASKFLLVYDNHDKRYLLKEINKLVNDLKKYILSINKRVNLDIKAGIYKQNSREKTMTVDDMLSLAFEALLDISDKDTNVLIYDESIYEDSYFINYEKELDILEAIDNNKLNFLLEPIYSIESKTILGYKYLYSFEDLLFDETTFESVISKRKLESRIDKYLIKRVFEDLKLFYTKTKSYYNAYIKLNNKSVLDKNIIEYIIAASKYYKVDLSYIYLEINGAYAHEFKNLGLNLYSSSIDITLKEDFNMIALDTKNIKYSDLARIKIIMNEKIIILENVLENEIENLKIISQNMRIDNSKKYILTEIIEKTVNKEKK